MPNHLPCSRERSAALAFAGLLVVTTVNADSLDTWNVSVGTSVSHDRNIFHLSDSADAQALTGSSSKSDVVTATNLGLKVDKPYSLQRFELDLNVVKYDYRKFDYLNFTATNYTAAWRWSLTPNLHGNLSSGRQESLNSFTDNQNFRVRNVRTNDDYRFDADLDLGASWHLLGGAFQTRRKNSATFIQERTTPLRRVSSAPAMTFRPARASAISTAQGAALTTTSSNQSPSRPCSTTSSLKPKIWCS
jgi:hypothetical protein